MHCSNLSQVWWPVPPFNILAFLHIAKCKTVWSGVTYMSFVRAGEIESPRPKPTDFKSVSFTSLDTPAQSSYLHNIVYIICGSSCRNRTGACLHVKEMPYLLAKEPYLHINLLTVDAGKFNLLAISHPLTPCINKGFIISHLSFLRCSCL